MTPIIPFGTNAHMSDLVMDLVMIWSNGGDTDEGGLGWRDVVPLVVPST